MDEDKKLAENDHRRLGQELDLFVTSELVGSGLPMLTQRGTVLREELMNYSNELRESRGFGKVWTPHITKTDLYKTSGHWDKFGDELFLVKSQETKDQLVLKPMNCPHHIQIYASKPRSYREMPLKFLETSTVYRDEKSGELQGLARVRSISMDDSHVFARVDQIESSIEELVEAAQELYKTLDMKLSLRLSFRDDSEGYLGEQTLWDKAQKIIEAAAKAEKLDYEIAQGDAAFYGPKIDFLATDLLNRVWQVATVQLDFVMPERFKLAYTDEQGNQAQPVMIHCALLGSIERFLAVYIEHTDGKFPVWLAPEQVRVVAVNDDKNTLEMADNIVKKASKLSLRTTVDDSNETLSKKIVHAEQMKVPYTLIIGPKEAESGQVEARCRGDLAKVPSMPIDEFLNKVSQDAQARH